METCKYNCGRKGGNVPRYAQAVRLYKLYILDLDGTLYRGGEVLPYAVEIVAELRGRGSQIRYVTNNSGQTRQAYVDKLTGMGFSAALNEVYSSAIASAAYCTQEKLAKVFVVGEPGLVATLKDAGIAVTNANDSGEVQPSSRGTAQALVAGIHRQFNYDIMRAAMQQVLRGVRFIATNTDATFPVEEDVVVPGAGAIVASLTTCTGVEPYVVGKPNPYMIELVMKEARLSPSDTLVVGDRYETDIESGLRAGVDTHLVLTGVAKEAPEGQAWSEDLRGILGDRKS